MIPLFVLTCLPYPKRTGSFCPRLVSSRYVHQIRWEKVYWQLALGGARELVLGLHNRGSIGFGDVKRYSIDEVNKTNVL